MQKDDIFSVLKGRYGGTTHQPSEYVRIGTNRFCSLIHAGFHHQLSVMTKTVVAFHFRHFRKGRKGSLRVTFMYKMSPLQIDMGNQSL